MTKNDNQSLSFFDQAYMKMLHSLGVFMSFFWMFWRDSTWSNNTLRISSVKEGQTPPKCFIFLAKVSVGPKAHFLALFAEQNSVLVIRKACFDPFPSRSNPFTYKICKGVFDRLHFSSKRKFWFGDERFIFQGK